MIVISNKLPLLTLLKLKQVDLLNKLYEKVVVPDSVYNDLINTIGNNNSINNTLGHNIIKVDINQNKVKEIQKYIALSQGVSEALEYGRDINDCIVLVDGLEEITYVQNIGLIYKRSIDVLYEAYASNFISSYDAFKCLDVMIENGIPFADSIIKIFIEQIGYDKYNEYKKQIGKDKDLFEKAVGDLKCAKSLYRFYAQKNDERYISGIAFHLQQALEKCIKSISIGNDMGENHDIESLISKAQEMNVDLLLSDYLISNSKMITSWDGETLQDHHDYKVDKEKVKEALPYVEKYLMNVSKEIFKKKELYER